MSNSPITILGAGNMASALALNLERHERPIRMYCIEPDVEEDIRSNRCNSKYLAGHRFAKNVTATNDLAVALNEAEDVFVAVPSFAIVEVVRSAAPLLSRSLKSIVSITKGIDPKTLQPIVMSALAVLPPAHRRKVCTLGGPTVATEMAQGSPTGFVVAGKDKIAMERVKKLLETETAKCATSPDLLGVGFASALKNPYAISLGMCDGLKYPANAKALVFTIALEEMKRLVVAAGGRAETVYGLAGLGDLIVTGTSLHGRNRTYGERLVGAKSKVPADLNLETVEGIPATVLAAKLARRVKARAPLLDAIDRCLRSRQNFEKPFVLFLTHLRLP